MKIKAIAIFSFVLLFLSLPAFVWAADTPYLSISQALGGSTTGGTTPASALIDGNANSEWRLVSGSQSGRALLQFSASSLIRGAEIDLTLPQGTILEIEYRNSGVWRGFLGGRVVGPFSGRLMIDLSYERARGDAVSLELSGASADAASIYECRIIGQLADQVERKLTPLSVASSLPDIPFFMAENLVDGNPWTSWGADLSPYSDTEEARVASSAVKDLKKYGHSPKAMTGSHPAIAAEITLPGESDVDTIRLHFLPNRRGAIKIEVLDTSGWREEAIVPEDSMSGWREIKTEESSIKAIRLSYEGPLWSGYRGLSEVELWGKGPPYGPSAADDFARGPMAIGSALNLTVNVQDPSDMALEFVLVGGSDKALSMDLNGTRYTASPTTVIGSSTLYRLFVSAESLCVGDNYIRLLPRYETDILRFARIAGIDRPDGELSFTLDSLWDGTLLTPGNGAEESTYEFGRTIQPRSIEAYSSNGFFPSLYVLSGDQWLLLGSTIVDAYHSSYDCPGTIDRIKIVRSGSSLCEVVIYGSPTMDQAPRIELLNPRYGSGDGGNYDSHQFIMGFVDNPDALVTVNGHLVKVKGHLFWIAPGLLDLPSDEIPTVVIKATDDQGRSATRTVQLIDQNSSLIVFDQGDGIIQTSGVTVTISGRLRMPNLMLNVGGVPATVSGNRFSVTLAVEEGFTLVPISILRKSNGKTIGVFYRRVIRTSSPPVIILDLPTKDMITKDSSVILRGMARGASPLSLTVNGHAASVSGERFTSLPIPLAEGPNTINLVLVDSFKRECRQSIVVIRDGTAPVVSFSSPSDGSFLSGNLVTVTGKATDANPFWLFVNGRPVAVTAGQFSIDLPFVDGACSIKAEAVDASGNTASAQVAFVVDTKAPEEFTVSIDPQVWTSTTTPTISFSTNDLTSGISRYELSVDGSAPTAITSPYVLPSLSDGVHQVLVSAYDKAGNARTSSTVARIDTTAPPPPLAIQEIPGDARAIIKWQAPSSDTVHYEISRIPAFNGEETKETTSLEYVDEGLVNGQTYSYALRAVDRANNKSAYASARITCGIAVEPYDPSLDTVAQYDGATLLIAPETLPENVTRIAITEVSSPEMSALAERPIIGSIMEFSAYAIENGVEAKQEDVSFEGDFLAQITYDPALLPPGTDEKNLGVYYFDTMWSEWFKVPDSAVDLGTHTIYFTTDHFTDFSIQPTGARDLTPQELQEAPFYPSSSTVKHEGLSVSPQGGALSTAMTELILPGPGGFDLVLRRIYDTATAKRDSAGTSADELKKNGDYAYSMGKGWRLDFPFIRKDSDEFLVRTPDGGVYSVNSGMTKVLTSTTTLGRDIRFERHEGEDFTLYAVQKLTSVPKYFLWFEVWHTDTYTIDGWRLYTKDGTEYELDAKGRLTAITDPSGTFRMVVTYNGDLISSITDARGRKLLFEYGVIGGVDYIKSIGVKDGAPRFPTAIAYTQDPVSGQLTGAGDIGSRTYGYEYSAPVVLKSGGVTATMSASALAKGASVTSSVAAAALGSSQVTISGGESTSTVSYLSTLKGPGIGTQTVSYEPKGLATSVDGSSVVNSFTLVFQHHRRPRPRDGEDVDPPEDSSSVSTFNLVTYLPAVKVVTAETETSTVMLTTNYSYTYAFKGQGQFIVSEATVDDGRTKTIYAYSGNAMSRTRSYGASKTDDLTATGTYKITEYVPLLDSISVLASASSLLIEKSTRVYDPTTLRLVSNTEKRSDTVMRITTFGYDAWGNAIFVDEKRQTGDVSTSLVTQSFFLGGGRDPDAVSGLVWPAGVAAASSVPAQIHSLLYKRGELASQPDGGHATRFEFVEYDVKGRLTGSSVRRGSDWLETSYTYDDAWGEVDSVTGPDGHVTKITYDTTTSSAVVLVTRTEKAVKDADGATHDIVTTSSAEMVSGFRLWQRDGRGYVTTYEYDALGRITRLEKASDSDGSAWEADPSGSATLLHRDGNPVTSVSYDDENLKVTMKDPMGGVTIYDFDSLGHLGRIEKTNRARNADGLVISGTDDTIVTTATYDGWGGVISIIDPLLHKTEYSYDAMGRLSGIKFVDGAERTMSFDYASSTLSTTDEIKAVTTEILDWEGNVLSRRRNDDVRDILESFGYDGFGRETSRSVTEEKAGARTDETTTSYDELGKKKSVTYPASQFLEGGQTKTLRPSVSYEYDKAGNLSAQLVEGPQGTLRTEFTNDALGRIIKASIPYTDYRPASPVSGRAETKTYYDDSGNKTRVIDPNSQTTEWTYSARNLVLSQKSPAGAITRYAYDKLDRVLSLTDPRGSGPDDPEFSIDYRYDDLSRLILGVLPGTPGSRPTVRLSYDARGNLKERREADGGSTSYEYDSRNRLLVETVHARFEGSEQQFITRHEYDKRGLETASIDGLGNKTTKSYDSFGRLRSVTSPLLEKTLFGYDFVGNRNSITDPRGSTATVAYDPFGRVVSTVDALGGKTAAYYDRLGNLVRTKDELEYLVDMAYDEFGRLIKETRSDGSVRSYAYDPAGNMVRSTDPNGTTTEYQYTPDYSPSLIIRRNSGMTESSSFGYDIAGALMWSVDDGVRTDYNNATGSYRPDAYGRVTSLSRSIDGKTFQVGYAYDSMGRVSSLTYPTGRSIEYRYDGSGRLKKLPGYIDDTIMYDKAGQLSGLTAANGMSLSTARDADGRLTRLFYGGLEDVAAFSFTYDSVGNITTKNGSSYSYDLLNRLLTASEKGRFISDSHAESKLVGTVQDDYAGDSTVSFTGEDLELAFDSASMSLGVDLGSSREISRVELTPKQAPHRVTATTIDVLTSEDNKNTWTLQKDYSVTLGVNGSIAIDFETHPRAQFLKVHCRFDDRNEDGQSTVDRSEFRNLKNSMLTVTFFNEERDDVYSYDAKGNRKTLSSRAGSLTTTSDYSYYPNTDRLKSDGKYGYAYDANGNLTEKGNVFVQGAKLVFSLDQGEYWRYEYDLQNRLVRVFKGTNGTASAVEVASYRYAADGLRLAKTKDGITNYFVYGIDGNLLSTLKPETSSDTIWVFGKKFAEVSTIEATTTTTFLATDHLGTVVAATDETGKVIWKGNLTAFGQDAGQSGLAERIASFTGKDFDADAGLYYFNARWYDLELGRFTTEDPIRDLSNWYVYCGNDPINYTDQTGLISQPQTMTMDGGLAEDDHRFVWLDSRYNADPEDLTPDEREEYMTEVGGRRIERMSAEDQAFYSDLSAKQGDIKLEYLALTLDELAYSGWKPEENPLDNLQTLLDAAGVVDPTGIADMLNAGISACRGDYVGAALGLISVLPLGDIVKLAKHADDVAGAAKAILNAAEAAGKGLSSFSRAGEFGFKPYNVLTKELKGTGLQAHHLIEQRFATVLGVDAKTMQSMALTPAEHQVFTNAWRAEIGYGAGTAAATRESVMAAARRIYSGYPEILKALGL